MRKTCAVLEQQGYLLREDVQRLMADLEKRKHLFDFGATKTGSH